MQNNQRLILVVDDNKDLRDFLNEGLSLKGYKVVSMGSGKEALEFLSVSNVDLIVSDIHMKDGNGMELLAKIRNSKNRTPVILISGEVEIDLDQAQNLGASTFLGKPFAIEDLASLIELYAI